MHDEQALTRSMTHDAEVVVVGAGLAGLTAARDLVRAGVNVVVLEARHRVGGRVVNELLPGGAPIEMGGQWVGPGQRHVGKLIADHGLTTYPTRTTGRHVAELRGRRSEYTGRVPRLSGPAAVDLAQLQLRMNWIARRVATDGPSWTSRRAERLDRLTLATWLDRNAVTAGARSFVTLLTESVFSAEPQDISALWAMFYVGAAGGLDALISTERGAQRDRIVGGSHRLAQAMADGLGEAVMCNAPVNRVEWGPSGVEVFSGERRIRGRQAIIAVPPPLAARLQYAPTLPADRDQLLQRMPMGRVVKVNVAYREPFWREAGLSGQAIGDSRPLGVVFDNTPHSGHPHVLVGFVEGRHADAFARMTPDARRRRVIDDLTGYFGAGARDPLAFIERDWAAEEFTRGCYGAFATPGALTRFGSALRAPIGPLHWAGAETATVWPGYMDGAVESGHRAAREIMG